MNENFNVPIYDDVGSWIRRIKDKGIRWNKIKLIEEIDINVLRAFWKIKKKITTDPIF